MHTILLSHTNMFISIQQEDWKMQEKGERHKDAVKEERDQKAREKLRNSSEQDRMEIKETQRPACCF